MDLYWKWKSITVNLHITLHLYHLYRGFDHIGFALHLQRKLINIGTDIDKNGYYSVKIDFECNSFRLHTSKNIQECRKLYQAAKKCFEDYDRIKTKILSSEANNRLINKSVKNF